MKQRGFTIVELLIVIVVIGILAAIVIVAFNGVQDRAKQTTGQSDIKSIAKRIEQLRVESTGDVYPATLTASMDLKVTKGVYNVTRNNWYYCVSPDQKQYALGAAIKGNEGVQFSSQGGLITSSNVSDRTTCELLDLEPKKINGSHMGYSWNGTTSTGAWSSWLN